MSIESVMLVCTGNICRSPLAEGLLRQLMPQLRVFSSGIGAVVGAGPTPETLQQAQSLGLDIAAHRAQQTNAFLVQSAQLILTAELHHKQVLEQHYPTCRGRVFRMAEGLPQQDIPDPYRQGEAAYQLSTQLIAQGMADWAAKIKQLRNE